MPYYSIKGQDKTHWSSHGENLSAQDIHNIILILQNPDLLEMFSYPELKILKMTIKTHIMQKALSTVYEIPEEEIEKFEIENRLGKPLKKEKKL